MKNIYIGMIIFLFIGIGSSLIAQDSLNINILKDIQDYAESQEEKQSAKNVESSWLLLRVGINSLVRNDVPKIGTADPTELNTWPSLNWGIEFIQMRVNLIKHKLNLKTGLGIDLNYYEFKHDLSPLEKRPKVEWGKFMNENEELTKNNLYAGYIRVPFMLNFETSQNRDKSFRIDAGVYGALRFGSRMKMKWPKHKLKVVDSFNLNTWTYGLTGAVGYGAFNIYANYSLVGLFKADENNGYDVEPFNIGIQLIPF